jgi:hypothetical protein
LSQQVEAKCLVISWVFFRNKKSFDELNNFIFNIYKSILNFNIYIGNKSINGLYPDSEIDILEFIWVQQFNKIINIMKSHN